VKLRRKLAFSDGSRFDSRAVVQSLRRLANPETASHMADLLAPLGGYGDYRAAVERGEDNPNLFRGARVIEPYSFEVILEQENAEFVRTLAHPATAPVQAKAAVEDPVGFSKSPVCVGPYSLAQPYEPGAKEIVLRRNPGYHDDAHAYTRGGEGWADDIVFKVFPEPEAAYQAWQRGEVDIAAAPSARVAEARQAYGQSLFSAPGAQVEYIGLPFGTESPFNDIEVRQALGAAIDRDRIANEVYGGSRRPATGFFPPLVGDVYQDDACRFEPPKERAKLPTVPIKLYFNDEFSHRKLVEAVAAQWREKLGVSVEPVALNWDEYLQRAGTGSGFDSAFRVSWTPKIPAAMAYVVPLFASAHIGNTNLSRFDDYETDRMLGRDIAQAADDGERILLLRKLEHRLCSRLPLIPVVFSETHTLVRAEKVGSGRRDGLVIGRDGAIVLRDLALRRAAP
jgi:oligopeptide transport system substrate-binding protein